MKIINKYVKRSRYVASRIWGRNALVLRLGNRKFNLKTDVFELGPESTYLWKLIKKKKKVKDLINRYGRKKKVSQYIAKKTLINFINKFAAKNLIEILNQKL